MQSAEKHIRPVDELETGLMNHMLRSVDPERALLIKIKAAWPRIAGNLACHSMPVGVRGEQLVVRTEHSVYQQELRLHSDTILQALMQRVAGLHLKQLRVERGRLQWTEAASQSTPEPDARAQSGRSVAQEQSARTQSSVPAGDRLEDLL